MSIIDAARAEARAFRTTLTAPGPELPSPVGGGEHPLRGIAVGLVMAAPFWTLLLVAVAR